jgi:pilus assembly protein Flp/PilA
MFDLPPYPVAGGVIDMRVLLARFLCEESGTTEIGYALIAAGMAVAIITVLSGLGSKLSMALTTVRAALE